MYVTKMMKSEHALYAHSGCQTVAVRILGGLGLQADEGFKKKAHEPRDWVRLVDCNQGRNA